MDNFSNLIFFNYAISIRTVIYILQSNLNNSKTSKGSLASLFTRFITHIRRRHSLGSKIINYCVCVGEQNFDPGRVGVVAGATAVSEETSSENVLSPEGSISTAGPEAEEAATTSVATRHQPTSRRATTYNQTVPRSAASGAACEMRRTPSSQNKGKCPR